MMNIALFDNNYNKEPAFAELAQNATPSERQMLYANLSEIADKTLAELTQNNPNLLIFPPKMDDNKEALKDFPILKLLNRNANSQELADAQKVKIQTSNLMGFLGVGETTIRIKSRFDQNENDHFLHYLLSKVFNINIFDFSTTYSMNDGALALLYFLFPKMLCKALKKGLFRTYQTFDRNDSAVKGAIDVARHIRENLPFNGKIAYKSREFSYDNEVTQLIRHTIEVIRQSDFGKSLLHFSDEMRQNVRLICQATPTYEKGRRLEVINQNRKPLTHSFFSEYRDLQRLCLLILRRKMLNFRTDKNEIWGILFDGAWLWEEYLAKLFAKISINGQNVIHPENKTGKNPIFPFKNAKTAPRYPDFYVKPNEQCAGFVFDAKYKQLLKGENGENVLIQRDDFNQMLTYLFITTAKNAILLNPTDKKVAIAPKPFGGDGELAGYGGNLSVISLPIPQNVADFSDFRQKMSEMERDFHHLLAHF